MIKGCVICGDAFKDEIKNWQQSFEMQSLINARLAHAQICVNNFRWWNQSNARTFYKKKSFSIARTLIDKSIKCGKAMMTSAMATCRVWQQATQPLCKQHALCQMRICVHFGFCSTGLANWIKCRSKEKVSGDGFESVFAQNHHVSPPATAVEYWGGRSQASCTSHAKCVRRIDVRLWSTEILERVPTRDHQIWVIPFSAIRHFMSGL